MAILAASRPTAVNLFWALDRMRAKLGALHALTVTQVADALLAEAEDWLGPLLIRRLDQLDPGKLHEALRARLGLPYWSMSRYLKLKVKRAVSYVADFEQALAREAHKRGAHGVVCGHIHHAEIRTIDGILYCNDGDWVESLTALVEHADGRLDIVHWGQVMAGDDAALSACRLSEQVEATTAQ